MGLVNEYLEKTFEITLPLDVRDDSVVILKICYTNQYRARKKLNILFILKTNTDMNIDQQFSNFYVVQTTDFVKINLSPNYYINELKI